MTPRVHQFVPELGVRDAIGRHILAVQATLSTAGIESHIWAGEVHPDLSDRAGLFAEAEIAPDDVLIYQFAVGHAMADQLVARSERLVIDYHNITPRHFFTAWDPSLVHAVDWGLQQLPSLADRCCLSLADSAFNAGELIELGFSDVHVLPILLDQSEFSSVEDEMPTQRESAGTNWLFVGRIVPNKAQHDLIKAFAAYRHLYDPDAQLHIVGSVSAPGYHDALVGMIADLGLSHAAHLHGSVSSEQLHDHYRSADVFVCLSEHEGFCVPLLEAMHHKLPVVAFSAGAVPETLGEAGILLDDKSPAVVASAVHQLNADPRVVSQLLSAAQHRLRHFDLERSQSTLLGLLGPLLDEA